MAAPSAIADYAKQPPLKYEVLKIGTFDEVIAFIVEYLNKFN
jgi:hypothetical protein